MSRNQPLGEISSDSQDHRSKTYSQNQETYLLNHRETYPQNEQLGKISDDGPDECSQNDEDDGRELGFAEHLNVLPRVRQFFVLVEIFKVEVDRGVDVGVLTSRFAHPRRDGGGRR